MAPGRKTLDDMAEAVAYDMWMLRTTTQLIELGTFPPGSADKATMTIANALLESSLLHLRSLDDFLGRKVAKRPDDVIARDYMPTWTPRTLLSPDERRVIDKQLVHMTTERTAMTRWQLQRSHDAYEVCWTFVHELKASQAFPFAFEKLLLWFPPKGADAKRDEERLRVSH